MTDPREETGGKALEWPHYGITLRLLLDQRGEHGRLAEPHWATANDLVACLLANPEARMAVLEQIFHGLSDAHPRDWDALVRRATEAEARFRDAAAEREALLGIIARHSSELIRLPAIAPFLKEAAERAAGLVENWPGRSDQALSVPTDEPESDTCELCGYVVTEATPRGSLMLGGKIVCTKCYENPAPVAEAPERVTHEAARGLAQDLAEGRAFAVNRDLMTRYIAQQEAAEREVVSLREDCADWRKQNADLRAKLSESERKLGGASRPLWHGRLLKLAEKWAEEARDESGGDWVHEPLARCANELNAELMALPHATELQPAAKEPTGGEPAKPDELCVCGHQRADHSPEKALCKFNSCGGCESFKAAHPTPPAAEAEPICGCARCQRQRLGPLRVFMSLCPKCGNKRCPKAEWHDYQCTGSNESGQVGVEERKEPADPAPPRPGGDRPVMMGELPWAKLLRDAEYELGEMLRQHGVLVNSDMDPSHRYFVTLLKCVKALAAELEREGSEKP